MGGAPDGGRLSGRPLPKKLNVMIKHIQFFSLMFFAALHLLLAITTKDKNEFEHRLTRTWIFCAAAILSAA